MRRGWLPRFQDFVFIIILCGAIISGTRMLNTDSDLGRHLILGRYMLTSRRIPLTDILSFTRAGDVRPPYEWLAQVLLASADQLLGLDGVVLLTASVIAAAFLLVFLDAAQRSRAPVISLVFTAWAAAASSLHWLARPHVFTFLFFAIWLAGLERLRSGERLPLWLFPGWMLLWANTHGGFVFGFLALGAYAFGWLLERMRGHANPDRFLQLLIVAATSLLATLLTPARWQTWAAVLGNRSNYVLSRTVETMPLNMTSPSVWPFVALLLAALVLLAIRKLNAPPAHLALLAGLAVAATAMMRNIPLFAVAAAPILSQWAAECVRPIWGQIEARFEAMQAAMIPYIWSCLALCLAVGGFAFRDARLGGTVFQFRGDLFPVQAGDWVLAHPQPVRMYNDFNWGGYLLYRLWPAQRVFIDSQSDFYGEQLTRLSADVESAQPGWQKVLNDQEVRWMLIPRSAPLAAAASSTAAWRVAYEDAVAIILVRR